MKSSNTKNGTNDNESHRLETRIVSRISFDADFIASYNFPQLFRSSFFLSEMPVESNEIRIC
jgi:hypothetical protein